MLTAGKIDLSLCGHIHFPYEKIDKRGRGENCSGSITRNGTFTEIDYDRTSDMFNFKEVDID